MPTKRKSNGRQQDEEEEKESYTVNKGAKQLWDMTEEEVKEFFQGGDES